MSDRQEARLVKGRVGAGELIHWPLSLGDSPAVILCLGEPSTSLTPPPSSAPPPPPPSVPTQVVTPAAHFSLLLLTPLLLLSPSSASPARLKAF